MKKEKVLPMVSVFESGGVRREQGASLWPLNCTFDFRDSGCHTELNGALNGSYLQRSAT